MQLTREQQPALSLFAVGMIGTGILAYFVGLIDNQFDLLDSGKVTAFDGTIASGGIAKDIVKVFAAAKLPTQAKK
ncbi:MAG TPA: hypothetical protein VF126_11610 [Acidobacteriaceae bacterium]